MSSFALQIQLVPSLSHELLLLNLDSIWLVPLRQLFANSSVPEHPTTDSHLKKGLFTDRQRKSKQLALLHEF